MLIRWFEAPNRGAIANRESRDLYNIRFPHQLRFDRAQVRVAGELMEYRDHLGQRIDFDANRDTIFMDYPTLEYLFTARFELRGLVGFDQIRRLATTFDDNNIRGIQNFLLHRRGALSNVVDIRQVLNVDVVIRDREQAERYAERARGRVLLPNENQLTQHFFLPVLSRTEFLNLYPFVVESNIRGDQISDERSDPVRVEVEEVEEDDDSPSNGAGAPGNAQ